jgi:adenylate kinase family enzyme
MLGPTDRLPQSTRRVLVAGATGAGKSTLRLRISGALGCSTVELDSLFHGPGWTVLPSFAEEVDRFSSGSAWVVEWQYSAVRPMLLSRSDLLVWLDHNRWTVMWRVVRRTVLRRLRRQHLWNGNYEQPMRTIFTDREHIVRWAWRTFDARADDVRDVVGAPGGPVVVRLRGQRQVDSWVNGPLGRARS